MAAQITASDASRARTRPRWRAVLRLAIAVAITVIFAAVNESLVRNGRFAWLATHPNSYGLRGLAYVLLLALGIGVLLPRARKYALGTALIDGVLLLLQLLGGPKNTP